MKIKDETTGQEIEVFTQAELDAKAKEASEQAAAKALEDFKKQNPDTSKELQETKEKLAQAERILQDAENSGKSDAQIARLRSERDEAKRLAASALEEATKSIDQKFEQWKKDMVGDTKAEYLEKLSAGDTELRKKIEFEFDNYRPDATSKKDIEDRMQKAYQLATGNTPKPSLLDGALNAGDRGSASYGKSGDKIEYKPNEIAIGKALGISDEDRKAYETYKAKNG